MPTVSMKPNSTNALEYIDIDLEAVEEDDEEEVGLALQVRNEGNEVVDIFETSAESIRAFRQLVITECDKALEALGD